MRKYYLLYLVLCALHCTQHVKASYFGAFNAKALDAIFFQGKLQYLIMFILCNIIFNGISRNLHFTLLIKKQGTCVDEVAKICEHMKEPCLPTLAYTEHEVYKTLCEVADCKLVKAIRLCPIQCVQSNYIFVLYLDLPNSSFLSY